MKFIKFFSVTTGFTSVTVTSAADELVIQNVLTLKKQNAWKQPGIGSSSGKKTPETYECQNDDPVLKIDWYERHLMDIGYMEETYEYYCAKKNKKNEEPLSEYQ
jgi:hypothetical protein